MAMAAGAPSQSMPVSVKLTQWGGLHLDQLLLMAVCSDSSTGVSDVLFCVQVCKGTGRAADYDGLIT